MKGQTTLRISPKKGSDPIFVALLLLASSSAFADRQPVLPQIAVPHDYYFREMYLPRLTTGPGSLAWMPAGDALVYSMQGSLWYQALDAQTTRQLTAGPGYDYQPDVSPDGTRVVFARYDGNAIELQVLDIESGRIAPLTTGGAVNTEPRFSPDGSRIAFVSTEGSGRFHVRIGAFDGGRFESRRLAEERRSETPRYYYSEWDHQLSPAWTPDGEALVLVANPEVPYGTGPVWRHDVDGDAEPVLVQKEETSWRAKPDVAPDGRRVAYASYLGRQWHQLWVTSMASDAEPFPLTYGDFDISSPRWSPDGSRIAYISNEHGGNEIRIFEFVGGRTVTLDVEERQYLGETGTLALEVVGEGGELASARVSIVAADGRSYAPAGHWMHADDGFDRDHGRFETHYFHVHDRVSMTLPAGAAQVTVWRGPEYRIEHRKIDVRPGRQADATIGLQRLDLPDGWDAWQSGDVHVHMNYGGTYRNTPARLVRQAQAEDLDVVFNLVVNKEQRIPDIDYFSTQPDPASNDDVLIVPAQEYHTSYWGHLGLLGLTSHLLIPDYAAYPGTAAASLYPDNSTIAELAHEQGAIVGYVHPYGSPPPDPANDAKLTHAFPVDAALGLADYYEVVGFADHRASAEVWHRLMNCGLRIPAAGGTDAMANYASLRGPVGLNRTYVRVGRRAGTPVERRDAWIASLKAGHSIATNAALLGFEVDGRGPGEEVSVPGDGKATEYRGFMRSAVPIDHLEVVHDGIVIDEIELDGERRSADFEGSVDVSGSGWILLRAWNESSHPLVFDLYPYATTTPVWLAKGGATPRSRDDAEHFIAWIERLRQSAAAHPDYNDDSERRRILARLDAASVRFEACR